MYLVFMAALAHINYEFDNLNSKNMYIISYRLMQALTFVNRIFTMSSFFRTQAPESRVVLENNLRYLRAANGG